LQVTTVDITVVGAGVLGLWQALTLARAGHRVRLIEASAEPFVEASSRLAGAMLLPDCEAESMPPLVQEFGRRGVALWRETYPGLVTNGSLVVAHARDRSELKRHARLTRGHTLVEGAALSALEPDLAGRFDAGLHYADEAHMVTPDALRFLLEAGRAAGVETQFGERWDEAGSEAAHGGALVIDCRGIAARADVPGLRGVRGERFIIRTDEVQLKRPVHLLHPRQPLYVVPWTDARFLIGATLIESEDDGPVTVRSALELLGMAYSLHPVFGEAEIVEAAAGVRPAFADNVPRAMVAADGRRIAVNGSWRHGFLMAPVLADAVAAHLAGGTHALLQGA
jgi:glycine oxidase